MVNKDVYIFHLPEDPPSGRRSTKFCGFAFESGRIRRRHISIACRHWHPDHWTL